MNHTRISWAAGPVVLGIAAHFHDSAAALLVGGELVAASHEERYTRQKQDPSLPRNAVRDCLDQAGLRISDVDCVAYYEDPTKKLHRQLWTGLPHFPDASEMALFRLDADRRGERSGICWDGTVRWRSWTITCRTPRVRTTSPASSAAPY
ncbi:carbamoyltransferase N-terminal domain-containing protein [Pilimelia columellifera]|uniref:Carbamoyltransferase domain-containing protein n=1 Tax=Pilimelia columellifera subsp. columellifera TaxID=706583 RepID=A0ABP6B137_9ACTN